MNKQLKILALLLASNVLVKQELLSASAAQESSLKTSKNDPGLALYEHEFTALVKDMEAQVPNWDSKPQEQHYAIMQRILTLRKGVAEKKALAAKETAEKMQEMQTVIDSRSEHWLPLKP